ncbi:pyridoxamine 5'-phosphate oxidase family protein [Clostridium sp. Mt-5]|uniref:Pyridoxamine 5'-phosphate oxidase family protein n=1 Tax=Clostridium moutaii TaxID=3240932 RepID=A0ABV4BNZ4_9CLOT
MKKMRRKDRIMDQSKIPIILEKSEYGILSTCDENNQPYAVPINYVYYNNNLYFHCANEGAKLDNISINNTVCFNIVSSSKIIPGEFTSKYESLLIFGKASKVYDKEKEDALIQLVKKYSPEFIENGKEYIGKSQHVVTVIKIAINYISGKENL